MKLPLLMLLCLLIQPSAWADTSVAGRINTVEVGQVNDTLALSSQLVYLADPDHQLDASRIATQSDALPWQHSTQDIPNLGLSAPPHWFSLNLSNATARDWSGLLAMSYTMIDVLDVFFAHQQTVTPVAKVGDQRPFSNRLLAHRYFLIPVTIPAGETIQVIMKGESEGALKLPLDIWRLPAFFAHDQYTLAPQIMFAGIMLALVLYNFFLLLATGDRNYLWYVLSMIAISFVVMSFHGILAQYVWPDSPALNNPVLVGAISTTIFAATLFAYSFLDLQRFSPWLKVLFLGHSGAGAVIFLLNLFLPYAITIKLAALFSVTGATMGICTGIYLWYRGEVLARFYTCAWFFLLSGSVTITFSHMGILPSNLIFNHGQQIGAVAEGLLLSFALAYRINMERQQRYKAQAQLLQVQTEANLLLEQKVQARTMELQEANDRLKEASATDGLTQVRNRHFFDEKLVHEWQKNSRANSQISLLLIDGDHFKKINDTFGHLCGDAMLKHIAALFRQAVNRAGDFVARYGGEEFSILLCHTDLKGAAIIAERICQSVASTPLQWEGSLIPFTVSIGVSNRLPCREDDPQSLLREADEALYQAKAAGRNRVMLYNRSGESTSIIPYP